MDDPQNHGTRPKDVRSLSRRRFLKTSVVALGAAAFACSGLGYAATRRPALDIPEPDPCGGRKSMNSKILIAYATRAGSTAGVAQAIADVFCENGTAVDVRPIKDVTNVNEYQTVILGSAIRYGQWLPEAVQFVEQNQAALNAKPTAFFAVHLMNLGEDEASRKARLAYLDAARKLVAPQAEAFFAGVGDLSKMSFLERLMSKSLKSPEGDLRDWQAIRGWAESLHKNGFMPA